ncbi:MAG TPA: hypothetical protein VK646_00655 [Actinomycetota bacterium]|nr:hypothetical protein [Actinomycetota bacterium]
MGSRLRISVLSVVVAVALVLGLIGVTRGRADATPALQPVGAQELLASAINASARPFTISGSVTSTVDVGLPSLPAGLGGGATGPAAMLLGTQDYRVWRSPDGVRLAHLTDLGEQVAVANATDAWFWDSNAMRAVHLAAPTASSGGDHPAWFAPILGGTGATGAPKLDPSTLASVALLGLAPYADVSVGTTAVVAGRPVYDLILTPTAPDTLIGRITVSIDAANRLPLQLAITPKGADAPAVRIGFTSVSFDPIDPSMFDFVPPPGATVVEPSPSSHAGRTEGHLDGHPQTVVFGSGFGTRIAVKLTRPLPAEAGALLPFGGPLFSVMTTRAGGATWLLAGPVGLDTLREDATKLP